MKTKHCLVAVSLATTSLAFGANVSSVIARGHKISVGDTADSVFASLKKEDMVSQDIEKATTGLILTKHYKVEGKRFILVFSRLGAEGPYAVIKIDSDTSPAPAGATATKGNTLTTIKTFEASNFYRKYKPKKQSWKLSNGATNYSYLIDDTENSGQSIGIDITEDKAGTNSVSVSWTGTSNLNPARMTKTKEGFLTEFLQAASPITSAADVVKYIKKAGSKNYPDGSNAMPRTTIGGLHMVSGSAGSNLIVGLER